MPKQRTLDTRIAEMQESLTRLRTMQKIKELKDSLPKQKRRGRR